MYLAVPSCLHSFWHGVIPTSYFTKSCMYIYYDTLLNELSKLFSIVFRFQVVLLGVHVHYFLQDMKTYCPMSGSPLRVKVRTV